MSNGDDYICRGVQPKVRIVAGERTLVNSRIRKIEAKNRGSKGVEKSQGGGKGDCNGYVVSTMITRKLGCYCR